ASRSESLCLRVVVGRATCRTPGSGRGRGEGAAPGPETRRGTGRPGDPGSLRRRPGAARSEALARLAVVGGGPFAPAGATGVMVAPPTCERPADGPSGTGGLRTVRRRSGPERGG